MLRCWAEMMYCDVQVRVMDEAESTLSSIDNASDRLVQSVLKQAHQSGNYSSGQPLNCGCMWPRHRSDYEYLG